MNVNVRDFLGYSYNHGDYITILNIGDLHKVIWEGKYETINNSIPNNIEKLNVEKWGIENNSIVICVNYKVDDLFKNI